MRRTARTVLLAVAIGSVLTAAAPGFAFDVQSGGVPLSAQSVALLANRLAARSDPAAAKAAEASGPAANSRMANGPMANGLARDERMMEFMLGGRPGTRAGSSANGTAGGAAGGLADLKVALRNRR